MFKPVFYLVTALVLTSKKSRGTFIRDCKLSANDFKTVLQSECFVDKSLLIRHLFTITIQKSVFFVSAPSRFGKTINMDMIKTFLEMQEGQTSQTLTEGCSLFKSYNLNIYKYRQNKFFYKHCGRYPVIYFNFMFIQSSSNYKDFICRFRNEVHKLFLKYKYLTNSKTLQTFHKKILKLYILEKNAKELTAYDLWISLFNLSQWLFFHSHKSVMILIDNFDAIYWTLFKSSFSKEDVSKTYKSIYNFLSVAFKKNVYLDKALVNSRLRFSKGIISNETVIKYPFLGEHSLVRYYGLTSEEVRAKLNYFNIKQRIEDIEYFYAGYNAHNSRVKIYNPWSVMNYLQTEVIDYYWTDPDGLVGLHEFFHNGTVRKLIIEALELGNITIGNSMKLSYEDIIILKDIMARRVTFTKNHIDTFIRFLLDNGYFTATARDSETVSITIPNEELHHRLFDAVTNNTYFKEFYKFDPINISEFQKALNSLRTGTNNTTYLVRFKDSVTSLFHNNKIPDSEIAFRGYIYNVIKSSEMFILTKIEVPLILKTNKLEDVNLSIKEKKSQTNGREETVARIRVDIMTTREKDGAGIVIETRRNRGSAEEALAQIVNDVLPNYDLFDSDDSKNKVKEGRVYIGLHLNTDTSVVTACCLVNDTNIKSKICV